MPVLTYTDSYLKALITNNLEARAGEDVADLGSFPLIWANKLTVLRAYILCCLESNADEEDVFTLKLKQYQREFDATLQQARRAAQAPTPGYFPLSMPLERG